MKLTLKPFLLLDGPVPVLLQAVQRLRTQPLPVVLAYKLNQLYREVLAHTTDCNEARNGLIKKLGTDGEIAANSEAMREFNGEIERLAKQEVVLAFNEKIRLPATVQLAATDLAVLEDFVELDG